MKKTLLLITVVLSLSVTITLFGCETESVLDASYIPDDNHEVSIGLPAPFRIIISDSRSDLKHEITSHLEQTHSDHNSVDSENATWVPGNMRERDISYQFNEISALGEFYFLDIDIEGFQLVEVAVDKYGMVYRFVDIQGVDRRDRDLDDWIMIDFLRPSELNTPDDAWQILVDQALQQDRGYLIEDNMVYTESLNDLLFRIGNTQVNLRVPNKLNNYEFLRNLALRIAASSELVTLGNTPRGSIDGNNNELDDFNITDDIVEVENDTSGNESD